MLCSLGQGLGVRTARWPWGGAGSSAQHGTGAETWWWDPGPWRTVLSCSLSTLRCIPSHLPRAPRSLGYGSSAGVLACLGTGSFCLAEPMGAGGILDQPALLSEPEFGRQTCLFQRGTGAKIQSKEVPPNQDCQPEPLKKELFLL